MSFDLRRFTPTLTVPALALAATFVGCGDGGGGGGGGAATGGTKPDATVTGGTTPDAAVTGGTTADLGPMVDAHPDAVTVPPDVGPDAAPDAAGPSTPDQAAVLGVPESARITLPGLSGPVQVVRTEADVPHLYARNELDLTRVQGYITARDRFFMMDLARRLAEGRLSNLLGNPGLATDITSRTQGMTGVAARFAQNLTATQRARWQAFAEGINAYIQAVRDNREPPPSEFRVAAALLGYRKPVDAMADFTVDDLAAFATTVLFQSGFERTDLEHELALTEAQVAIASLPQADQRRSALFADLFEHVAPMVAMPSIEGFPGVTPADVGNAGGMGGGGPAPSHRPTLPQAAARGLLHRLERADKLLGHIPGEQFGSNAWAVGSAGTPDGTSLVSGDGHLDLSVPGLFYQTGLDTTVFGAPDAADATHVMGLFVPGLPLLGVGTNGKIAWSFTYFYGDLVDWYSEDLRLDAQGRPDASRFGEAWQPLTVVDETYDVANVPALQSVGRQEHQVRFELFDGRRLMAVEGRPLADGEVPGANETVVNLGDGPWVPQDMDGDGIVQGISFDYTGLDAAMALDAYDSFSQATSVEDMRTKHKRLAVFGSHFAAADDRGHILDTGYHAVPCRANLDRTADGHWAPGADPSRLLDGTRYGGFHIPFNADGTLDEAAGDADPASCVVKFDDFPASVDPARGYVFTANNDPAGYSFDNNLANDAVYIGTSYDLGFRARTIHDRLESLTRGKQATPEAMSALQGDHVSVMAQRYVEDFLAVLNRAADDPALAAVRAAHPEAFDDVAVRLARWRDRGFVARSGVETFYARPDADEQADAVATMIFNTWLAHTLHVIFDDEGLPEADRVGDRDGLILAFDGIWHDRGDTNSLGLVSYDSDRHESVYFDDVTTPEVETSDVMLLRGLASALDFLASPPDAPSEGGFGTTDANQWLWGLRHTVRFDSLLLAYLEGQPGLSALLSQFSITPSTLPLMPDLPADDPRASLPGFPRDGDGYVVDAAHPGFRKTRFEYRHAPVFRMVVSLKDGAVGGSLVLPGGQSGLNNSAHFADQAALWLGNQTLPLRFHVSDVVAGATGREVFTP